MKNVSGIFVFFTIVFLGVSCSKKISPGEFSSGLGNTFSPVFPESPNDPSGGTEKDPEEEPVAPKGPSGYGKGNGCDGVANSKCLGGFDNDTDPVTVPVKVVLASDPGQKLTNDPQGFSNSFINKMNKYYIFEGHTYMALKVDEVVEDDGGLGDNQLITKYANSNGRGVLTMILVADIPRGTAGYVRNSCALMEQGQAWTVFEFDLVNAGVVEHETNHIFCFPHTSSANGGQARFYLSGYNEMEAVLRDKNAYKKPFNPEFKIYIDRQNRSDAKVENDGMTFDTHNLMYYSVLRDRPALFTAGSTGYHYSYSHLIDYYYWNFVKPGAKK